MLLLSPQALPPAGVAAHDRASSGTIKTAADHKASTAAVLEASAAAAAAVTAATAVTAAAAAAAAATDADATSGVTRVSRRAAGV